VSDSDRARTQEREPCESGPHTSHAMLRAAQQPKSTHNHGVSGYVSTPLRTTASPRPSPQPGSSLCARDFCLRQLCRSSFEDIVGLREPGTSEACPALPRQPLHRCTTTAAWRDRRATVLRIRRHAFSFLLLFPSPVQRSSPTTVFVRRRRHPRHPQSAEQQISGTGSGHRLTPAHRWRKEEHS
jgi:hypothetical protein